MTEHEARLYVCGLCESIGTFGPFKAPVDEVGATLMQQHLKSEHGVGFAGEFSHCHECGGSVLVLLGQDGPLTCKEHS